MPDFGAFVSLLAKFTLKFVVKETLSILRESNPKKHKINVKPAFDTHCLEVVRSK